MIREPVGPYPGVRARPPTPPGVRSGCDLGPFPHWSTREDHSYWTDRCSSRTERTAIVLWEALPPSHETQRTSRSTIARFCSLASPRSTLWVESVHKTPPKHLG